MKKIYYLIFMIFFVTYHNIQTLANYNYNSSFLYGGTEEQYLQYVNDSNNNLNSIYVDYFTLNPNGSLKINKINTDFIAEMHQKNIKVMPFLSNHWDQSTGIAALNNNVNLISQISLTLKKYNFDGVNIDIENIPHTYREKYTTFCKMLKEKVAPLTVSVSVAANPYNWKTGWQASYDYTALANYCDYLNIIGYDESYFGGPEGPVSSSDWLEESIQYALKQTTADKIVISLPFFGRYWKKGESTGGNSITKVDIENLRNHYENVIEYNTQTQSTKMNLTISKTDIPPKLWGGKDLEYGEYEVWYDDDTALQYKLKMIEKYGLRGVSNWALGHNWDKVWNYHSNYDKSIPKSFNDKVKNAPQKQPLNEYNQQNGSYQPNSANLQNGTSLPNSANLQNGTNQPNSANLQNGTNQPNSANLQNGTDQPNSANLQNGTNQPNSANLQNGTNQPNSANLQNGTSQPNGIAQQNDTSQPNGIAQQNDTNQPNGIAQQNDTNQPNDIAQQNDTNQPNGIAQQNNDSNFSHFHPQGAPNYERFSMNKENEGTNPNGYSSEHPAPSQVPYVIHEENYYVIHPDQNYSEQLPPIHQDDNQARSEYIEPNSSSDSSNNYPNNTNSYQHEQTPNGSNTGINPNSIDENNELTQTEQNNDEKYTHKKDTDKSYRTVDPTNNKQPDTLKYNDTKKINKSKNNLIKRGWLKLSEYEPNGNITHNQALKVLLRMAPALRRPPHTYKNPIYIADAKNSRFIKKATYYGLIAKTEIPDFNSTKHITKGEFLVYIDRLFNLPDTVDFESEEITDIFKRENPEMYYAINKYYAHKIISVDEKGNFYPNSPLKAEEMIIIVDKLNGAAIKNLQPHTDPQKQPKKIIEPR